MLVIALSGLARAGKDTVADILVAEHGFTKMAFATPLKEMVRELDPIIGHELYAGCCNECDDNPEVEEVRLSDAEKFGFSGESLKHSPWADEVRRLWERFGTDVMRKRHPGYWVDEAREAILASGADRIVLSDCRFPDEADMVYGLSDPLWDFGGDRFEESPHNSSVWHITRPGLAINLGPDAHEAESHAGQMAEEITIHNDGTLESLAENVEIALGFVTTGSVKTMAEFSWLKAFNAGRWRKQ